VIQNVYCEVETEYLHTVLRSTMLQIVKTGVEIPITIASLFLKQGKVAKAIFIPFEGFSKE
jgi:hypothetical protein